MSGHMFQRTIIPIPPWHQDIFIFLQYLGGILCDYLWGAVSLYNRLTDVVCHCLSWWMIYQYPWNTCHFINESTCGSCMLGHQFIFSTLSDSTWTGLLVNSGTRRKWVISFTTRTLYPGRRGIGVWGGSKFRLDAVEKRKLFCPWSEYNPRRPARSSSLYRLSYPGSCE
jgi:hypothetical protein